MLETYTDVHNVVRAVTLLVQHITKCKRSHWPCLHELHQGSIGSTRLLTSEIVLAYDTARESAVESAVEQSYIHVDIPFGQMYPSSCEHPYMLRRVITSRPGYEPVRMSVLSESPLYSSHSGQAPSAQSSTIIGSSSR